MATDGEDGIGRISYITKNSHVLETSASHGIDKFKKYTHDNPCENKEEFTRF